LRNFFIAIFILFIQNLTFGQINAVPDLSKYISELSEDTNYNKIDSVITSFLNQYPNIGEKEFQNLLSDFYTEDDLKQLAIYYFITGLFYEKQANYIAAIKAYLTAIEFVDGSKPDNYLVYYKTGFCYERIGYSQEAIDYYLESVSYPGIEENKLIEIYKNIGNCSIGLEKYEQSIEYYNKSYNAAKLIGDTTTMIKTVINSGNTYLRAKNYLKASEVTNKAYNLSKEHNYYLGMAFKNIIWV
jgi:tetratricopeptide (TPR) repeat protein